MRPDPRLGQIIDSQAEERRRAESSLPISLRRFHETGSPVDAWEAIADWLLTDQPRPESLRTYLYKVAATITNLSRDQIPTKGKVDRAIRKALGFQTTGRRNPFRELTTPGHEFLIAMQVYQCQTRNRHWSWKAVFADVAESHHRPCDQCKKKISSAKVKQYWYKRALQAIPPHLIDRAKSKKLDDILR